MSIFQKILKLLLQYLLELSTAYKNRYRNVSLVNDK